SLATYQIPPHGPSTSDLLSLSSARDSWSEASTYCNRRSVQPNKALQLTRLGSVNSWSRFPAFWVPVRSMRVVELGGSGGDPGEVATIRAVGLEAAVSCPASTSVGTRSTQAQLLSARVKPIRGSGADRRPRPGSG